MIRLEYTRDDHGTEVTVTELYGADAQQLAEQRAQFTARQERTIVRVYVRSTGPLGDHPWQLLALMEPPKSDVPFTLAAILGRVTYRQGWKFGTGTLGSAATVTITNPTGSTRVVVIPREDWSQSGWMKWLMDQIAAIETERYEAERRANA